MKNIAFLALALFPLLSSGQHKEVAIKYGLLKTTYYHDSLEVGKKEFKNVIRHNENVFKTFKQGRALMTTGGVIGAPGIILLLVSIENQNKGNPPYAWQWAGGIGGTVVGSVLYYSGYRRTLKAVDIYNSYHKMSIGLSGQSGLGLSLHF